MPAKTVKPPVRTEYLIDRYAVVHDSISGWHCACDEFTRRKGCRHTRESEGRRAAQAMIAERLRSVNGVIAGFTHRAPEPEKSSLRLRSKRRR